MKEVKNQVAKEVKRISLLNPILSKLKEGKYPAQIAKELSISKQVLSYYTRKLQESGKIEKIGYGVWKTNFDSKLVAKSIRGHAFLWKVKIPKKIDWENVLKSKSIPYKILQNKTKSILFKDKKVWLGLNNVIIYDLESYFGLNSVDTRKYAIDKLLNVLRALESKLGIDLKRDNKYSFKVARQHYSLINNCLAIQCNKENRKIQVSNDKGLWFLIDNSWNLNEAENVHPETALTDSLNIQRYFNEHKETKFEVTPKFILKVMDGIQQNQLIFDKNMSSHLKVLNKIGNAIDKLNKRLEQRSLGEYL